MNRRLASIALVAVLGAGGFFAGREVATPTPHHFQASYATCVASRVLDGPSTPTEKTCETWNQWQADIWRADHVDSGLAARYDQCTYKAFTGHTSPVGCYRYLEMGQ